MYYVNKIQQKIIIHNICKLLSENLSITKSFSNRYVHHLMPIYILIFRNLYAHFLYLIFLIYNMHAMSNARFFFVLFLILAQCQKILPISLNLRCVTYSNFALLLNAKYNSLENSKKDN